MGIENGDTVETKVEPTTEKSAAEAGKVEWAHVLGPIHAAMHSHKHAKLDGYEHHWIVKNRHSRNDLTGPTLAGTN
jgi:hypothetical protein